MCEFDPNSSKHQSAISTTEICIENRFGRVATCANSDYAYAVEQKLLEIINNWSL